MLSQGGSGLPVGPTTVKRYFPLRGHSEGRARSSGCFMTGISDRDLARPIAILGIHRGCHGESRDRMAWRHHYNGIQTPSLHKSMFWYTVLVALGIALTFVLNLITTDPNLLNRVQTLSFIHTASPLVGTGGSCPSRSPFRVAMPQGPFP